MRAMKLLGAAMLAALAVSAVGASAAFAGPTFEVPCHKVTTAGTGAFENSTCTVSGGTKEFSKTLLGGESETIEAKAEGAQVLTASSVELECSGVSVAAGAKIEGGSPGTDTETLIYTGCIRKGHSTCEARTKSGPTAGQIETLPLKSELVYRTKALTSTDTLFVPVTPSKFVEVELKGTECGSITSGTVEGSVAVENEAGLHVEGILTAPATPIKKVFDEHGTEKTVGLKAFGFLTASYVGKDKVKLSGALKGGEWGVLP
jgi:hypothetical protein